MKRGIVRLSVLLLLLTASAFAQGGEPQPVFVFQVERREISDRLEALGTLQANESVVLTAGVTDIIGALHFDDGDRVEKGQLLVEMRLQEEQALLDEARAQAEEARSQYERLLPLAKQGGVSASQRDEFRREMQTAQARLAAIGARLADRRIHAPFAGVLGLRQVSPGSLIEPGDPISTLDDDSRMKLDFTVPSVFLPDLRPGLAIEARTDALGDRIFTGSIRSIDSRVDPVTRAVRVRALIPNPDRLLKPGLLMKVDLLRNPRSALVIPEEALMPSGRENQVLVVDESVDPPVAQRRSVTIGTRLPGEVEVTQGLLAGELVITHGSLNVRPGQSLSIAAVDSGDEPLSELLKEGRSGERR